MNDKINNAQGWVQAAMNDARSIEQSTDSIKQRDAARAIIGDLHSAFESLAKVSHQLPAVGIRDEPVSIKAVS